MIELRKLWIALCYVMLTSLVSGCTGGGGGEATSGNQAVMSDEQQLAERALDRWNAILKRDFETAYSFTTPAFRAAYTSKAVQRYHGGSAVRTNPQVKRVEIGADGDSARVLIGFKYYSGAEGLELDASAWEKWVKQDGQWWVIQQQG